MTPADKIKRVIKLCQQLKEEENAVIVESRIEGLAKELNVSPFWCAFIYWSVIEEDEFKNMFGNDVKVRFRAK